MDYHYNLSILVILSKQKLKILLEMHLLLRWIVFAYCFYLLLQFIVRMRQSLILILLIFIVIDLSTDKYCLHRQMGFEGVLLQQYQTIL